MRTDPEPTLTRTPAARRGSGLSPMVRGAAAEES